MSKWSSYVEQHSYPDSNREIANKVGVSEGAISRWRRGQRGADVRAAAAFARAYGRPVLEAFVAAGFLTEREAQQRPAPDLDRAPSWELAQELVRRASQSPQEPHPRPATAADGRPVETERLCARGAACGLTR